MTKQGAVARFVRTRLVPAGAPVAVSPAAVRRFLFRTVSQIGVNYRNSPLSEGAAGAVRGGDRLPWVEGGGKGGQATDNFAPLESLRWQGHCYGEAPSSVRAALAARGLALHTFAWRASMRRAGLRKNAVYLIRPDGYVGLADATGGAAALEQYLEKHQIRAADRSETTGAAEPGRPVPAPLREAGSVGV